AVKTQICIALSVFLLVAIIKKLLKIDRDLYEILQILSLSQFEKTPINTLLSEADLQIFTGQPQKQQGLWDI
ncbi:MAG: IS4 family transposase, partial [Parcubacteria group bacterium CG_4_10_14_0_2_um_filter_7_35_8]